MQVFHLCLIMSLFLLFYLDSLSPSSCLGILAKAALRLQGYKTGLKTRCLVPSYLFRRFLIEAVSNNSCIPHN